MFVYGAFSNYQKVSTVFNVMTAISAAPAALGKTALKKTASRIPPARSTSAAWKAWQLVAVRTGTVGAIAAGGVVAYTHRQRIMNGVRSVRNLNKESVKEGYQQGIDTLSQGLAYINSGNVGRSFEYLSDHFTFVGTLMKQAELSQRLDRLAALKGIGVHVYYTSLGENGMWSGGYFVPERTFCAVPAKDHQAYPLFSRQILKNIKDEVQAHMSMFIRDKNEEYEQMMEEASNLVTTWFNDDSPLFDDPKFASHPSPEPIDQLVTITEDGQEVLKTDAILKEVDIDPKILEDEEDDEGGYGFPSPLDITAAAALVPLPDDVPEEEEEDGDDEDEGILQEPEAEAVQQSTYMQYLMRVAGQARSGVKSYVPTKMPDLPQIPSGPSFKSYIPNQMPQMPRIPKPSVHIFSKKISQSLIELDKPTDEAVKEAIQESATETETPARPAPGAGRKRADSGVHLSSEPIGSTTLKEDLNTKASPIVAAAK